MFEMIGKAMTGRYSEAIQKLDIRGDSHGIRMGWFFWPANYDPVWLENCNGFYKKGGQ
jgi:hypothetical protein